MTDIVERLREGRSNGTALRWAVTEVHKEAADEIERLRALLREAIEVIGEAEELVGAWGSYASNYFQDKHGLSNDVEMIRKFHAKIKETLNDGAKPKEDR